MKTIRVVAAVIVDNMPAPSRVFATARGYGEFKGMWEFPGGKIELGESAKKALDREIMEELDTKISVGEFITTVEHDYPTFHLSMDCFWAEVVSGNLELKEAQESRWLTNGTLDCVEWLPADIMVVEKIRKSLVTF